jgi:uncharacterized protein YegP (UPF0339 family)
MEFVIYEDNGGQFHWRLVGEDGRTLAVSAGRFATSKAAHRAAADVHDGAGAARYADA